jgi:hypothetical protein
MTSLDNIPNFLWPQVQLTAIYTELGRHSDARSALEEALRIDPTFTIERFVEDARKANVSDDGIRLWAAALRKAGLPE